MSSGSGATEKRLLPQRVEDRLVGWLARAAGVLLVAVGVASWAAVLTWSANDPSLSHASTGVPGNLLGSPGAIAADLMLQTLGFAVAFALFAPLVWGGELAAAERIPGFRIKLCLLPLSLLALAGAASALPRPSVWPLHHGVGGILGDVVFGVFTRLLAQLNPDRAALAAGLGLAVLGFLAALSSLGISAADLASLLRPRKRAPRTDRQASPAQGEPRFGRREPPRPANPMPPPLGAGHGALHAAAAPPPPMPPYVQGAGPGFGPLPVAPAAMPVEVQPPFLRPQPVRRGDDFDASTDLDSRGIAERFAPASARAASAPQPAPAGAPGPARRSGGLFGVFSARGREGSEYKRPSLNLLKRASAGKPGPDFTQAVLRGNARLLEDVLADFGVKGEIKDIRPGPVVTLFELEPARGTKSSRVVALADDIARSMSATSARVAVVPGRNAIGIELPNVRRETVYLRELLEGEAFRSTDATLPLVLGKSIGGEPIVVDLARMPHLLVAGTTGSGKSVGVNAMILSLLYRLPPEQCRFLMIDPKMLELSIYNGIPHLLTPVVTDPQKAVGALDWVVREMEERYKRMAQLGVRNIEIFNNRVRNARKRGEALARTVQTGFHPQTGEALYQHEQLAFEPLPYIVVVVDEFADLMIVAGKEIESAVQRLAQMARAAGIHLIMATQRPSVDIITGTIKANFPTRISFKVASKIDSRTILNEQGAEQLLGQGDMLFSNGSGHALRIHGPFVSDEEVESIAAALRAQGEPRYVEGIGEAPAPREAGEDPAGRPGGSEEDLYDKAVAIVLRDRKASTSYVQRRLAIGYNRAADLIERMERDGIVGPASNVGKRDILIAGGPATDAA